MTRLFLAIACVFLLILRSYADKEYEDQGHGHHHHHHQDHDGRKFIHIRRSLYIEQNRL
jgi:hypothetical protein